MKRVKKFAYFTIALICVFLLIYTFNMNYESEKKCDFLKIFKSRSNKSSQECNCNNLKNTTLNGTQTNSSISQNLQTPGKRTISHCGMHSVGIGNILFMYASLIGIARKNEMEPVIRWHTPLSKCFDLKTENISRYNWNKSMEIIELRDKRLPQCDLQLFNLGSNANGICLMGQFNCWTYFRDSFDEVRRNLIFKQNILVKVAEFKRKYVKSDILIGIHVRRGDFIISVKGGYAVAPASYFKRSMDFFRAIFPENNFTEPFTPINSNILQSSIESMSTTSETIIYSDILNNSNRLNYKTVYNFSSVNKPLNDTLFNNEPLNKNLFNKETNQNANKINLLYKPNNLYRLENFQTSKKNLNNEKKNNNISKKTKKKNKTIYNTKTTKKNLLHKKKSTMNNPSSRNSNSRLIRIQFVVCSNDIAWCKQNIQSNHEGEVIFSEGNSREVDLSILASCNHTIISAGTFGWWAAWLANGINVYYKNFPRENSFLDRRFSKAGYYMPHWIPME